MAKFTDNVMICWLLLEPRIFTNIFSSFTSSTFFLENIVYNNLLELRDIMRWDGTGRYNNSSKS